MSEKPLTPLVFKRSEERQQNKIQPIVIKYKSRKKGKKQKSALESEVSPRFSRSLEDVQKVEGDLVRVARRASRAVSRGIDTYDKERKKSAAEKKDGAIEDFPHNTAKAVSTSLKEASEIPVDIVDSLSTKNYRKQVRRNLRRASRALRIFRF